MLSRIFDERTVVCGIDIICRFEVVGGMPSAMKPVTVHDVNIVNNVLKSPNLL